MSIDEHTEDAQFMTCSEKPNSSKQQRVFKKLVKVKKGYYSIIWEEDGEEYEGYSSFSLDVISDFLREYFIPEQNFPTRMPETSDLISRAEALDMVYRCEDEFGKDVVFRLADYIERLPSVQPEIIHCKDCRFVWKSVDGSLWCNRLSGCFHVAENDFCSFAKGE